ncbi:glycosyltransferase family 4 protein [Patescibacteria group bacterium]|nr:glycosyltransferase family 4 protein [Patescibacteria group bacterium]
MKYCLINNLYPPYSIGGAERIVQLIAKGLKSKGEVVVITTGFDKDIQINTEEDIKVYRLNPKNIFPYTELGGQSIFKKILWHYFDLYNFKLAKKVEKILSDEKPDFVFTHNLKGFSYQLPKIISKLKIKHLHYLHDYQLIDPHGSLFRKGRRIEKLSIILKIYKNVCKKLFSGINCVISPSRFALEKHQQYGFFPSATKVVLPNPISFDQDSGLSKKTITEKIRLLYLGQIEEQKGVRFLIESFNKYPKENFELTLVGDGSLLNELKKNTTDPRIKFSGKVSQRHQLKNIFFNTDITIIPSLWWENSPTVVYESYSYGVPVLVSDSGGSKELVKDNKTGYIFKSGDISDFTRYLDKISQNRQNLAELGVSGRQFIQEYQLESYIRRLLDLCQNLKT